MKKYFVITDVHSFYTIMMNELINKGFEVDNPDHIIISCGDMFDRGDESKQMLDFMYDMYKKDRLINIRGNHDDLLVDAINRGFPESYDYSNGTIKTICDLQPTKENYNFAESKFLDWAENVDKRWFELYYSQILFYETNKYIFVHGWIPYGSFTSQYDIFEYNPEWRYASKNTWKYKAEWANGMRCWKLGIREPDKTIVCGHYHCSYGWSHIRQKYKEFPDKNNESFKYSFTPFIDDGIIAFDACTAYSKKMNILVFNEDDL